MWTTYEDVNGKTQVCRVGFWGDEYELLKVPSVRPSRPRPYITVAPISLH